LRLSPFRALLILTSVICGGQAWAADEPPRAPQLETAIAGALSSTGPAYVRFREVITGVEPEAMQSVVGLESSEGEWSRHLLGAILRERITKGDQIDAAVAAGIEVTGLWPHGACRQSMMVGKLLADRFRDTPMVLAEYLWKDTSLAGIVDNKTGRRVLRGEMPYAAPVHALTLLAERRAAPLLVWLLEQDKVDFQTKRLIGASLAALRATDCLSELLRIAEHATDPEVQAPALQALPGCVDDGNIGLVRRTIAKTESPDLRAVLGTVLMAAEAQDRPLRPFEGTVKRDRSIDAEVGTEPAPACPDRLPASDSERLHERFGVCELAAGLLVGMVIGAALARLVWGRRASSSRERMGDQGRTVDEDGRPQDGED